MMEALGDELLLRILARLSAAELAAAELVSMRWATIIGEHQLWRLHAPAADDGGGAAANTPLLPLREAALHAAATARWCGGGKPQVLWSMQGATAATSAAVLDDVALLGGAAADSTARLLSLQRPQAAAAAAAARPLRSLQGSGGGPVVAVALPSAALAATATAQRAWLWRVRDGQRLRSFEPLPGGAIACLALTDTQLILGGSAGALQAFDVYSGRQQLITRYGSGVSALLAVAPRPQQQHGQQRPHGDANWRVVVGTRDGAVSCACAATGRVLWRLPTRAPATVTALQLDARERLLYVLNARSQLLCWRVPPDDDGGGGGSSSSIGGGADSAAVLARRPLAAVDLPDGSSSGGGGGGGGGSRQRVGGGWGAAGASPSSFEGLPPPGCRCLLLPEFGRGVVFAGSGSGQLCVVRLEPAAAGGSSGGDGGGDGAGSPTAARRKQAGAGGGGGGGGGLASNGTTQPPATTDGACAGTASAAPSTGDSGAAASTLRGLRGKAAAGRAANTAATALRLRVVRSVLPPGQQQVTAAAWTANGRLLVGTSAATTMLLRFQPPVARAG